MPDRSAQPALPVPPLTATLDGLVAAVSAMGDEALTATTRRRAEEFRDGDGPTVQQALEEFAAERAEEGHSWLSEAWLSGYLTVRTPLPTATNVSFQLNPARLAPRTVTSGRDLVRVTEFLHRAVTIHLTQARGETPQEVDGRGSEIDMTQWQTLAGGIRHPWEKEDRYRVPRPNTDQREVGIFLGGELYPLCVSTVDSQVRPAAEIIADLKAILADADSRADNAPSPSESWCAPSFVGSEALVLPLRYSLSDPDTAATYVRLSDMLFTLSLRDEDPGVDTEGADAAARLQRLTFSPGQCWAYKPLSYEMGLRDDWLCVHVEHSTIDGATLAAAVKRMQELDGLEDREGLADVPAAEMPTVGALWPGFEPFPFTWAARPDVSAAAEAAAPLRIALVTVPRRLPAELPFTLSADAAQQFILGLAQQLAFGRVRSAYEAVDMREYQAGRTECLRSMTPAAVELIRALAEGTATVEQLQRALEAHRGWVKACKKGQGLDRHLLGWRLMAQRAGISSNLLSDEGVAAMSEDFLSTTSLGSDAQILRYAFAPAVSDGFGVTYTPVAGGFEFCVSWDSSQVDSTAFLDALPRAAELLWDLVAEAA